MKKLALAFGRFNPPHIGHGHLINSVISYANENDCDYRIHLSNTVDSKKNPLTPDEKLYLLHKFFPGVNFVKNEKIRSPFNAMEQAAFDGYTEVCMLTGEDRFAAYQNFIGYADEAGLEKIVIQSIGIRNEDGDDIQKASSTRLRQLLQERDFESAIKLFPQTLSSSDIRECYQLMIEKSILTA